jgi:outer membrane protein OmpA-like peptidoglycan-associated protein
VVILVGLSLFGPSRASAESGRLHGHLDVGFGGPIAGEGRRHSVGGAAWLGLDYQLHAPFAIELIGGGGGFSKPLPGSGLTGAPFGQFALGLRARLLDDHAGYANQPGGNVLGDLWVSAHLGYVRFDGRQFGVDFAVGYELSVVKPLSLGAFLRTVLAAAGENDGPDMLLIGGLSASLELVGPPRPPDSDSDGLSDEEEAELGTDPRARDTDRDGLPDGLEASTGTDPRSPDTDRDGLSERREDRNRNGRVDPGETDPRVPDHGGLGGAAVDAPAEPEVALGEPLAGVRFEDGRSRLAAGSEEALAAALPLLSGGSDRFEVAAYVAGGGAPADEARLTQRRAEVVMNWLVAHGVARERLVARGYGAADPIAPNDTPEGRAKNDRVVLRRLAE